MEIEGVRCLLAKATWLWVSEAVSRIKVFLFQLLIRRCPTGDNLVATIFDRQANL